MNIILRELTESDEQAFLEGAREWVGESPHWYSFIWPGVQFLEMIELLKKESLGIDIKPDRVPHTMLYAFLDEKIIGRVSVRHSLNEHLRKRGGHIGYAVAKSYRKRGYATEMVRQTLDFCKKINLNSILITCADENLPSWKIIEYFNGQLENRVWDDEDKEMIRRYWIAL